MKVNIKDEIEEGVFIANKVLGKETTYKAYEILSNIEKIFYIIEKLEYEKRKNILDYFNLPKTIFTINKIRAAVVYVESLISAEDTKFGFRILSISNLTKKGNYIHKIQNAFNVKFNIAFKQ